MNRPRIFSAERVDVLSDGTAWGSAEGHGQTAILLFLVENAANALREASPEVFGGMVALALCIDDGPVAEPLACGWLACSAEDQVYIGQHGAAFLWKTREQCEAHMEHCELAGFPHPVFVTERDRFIFSPQPETIH